MLSILFGNIMIWVAYYTASYTSYIVGALSFSLLLYLLIVLLYFLRKERKPRTTLKVDMEVALGTAGKLEAIMKEKQLFLNHNLKLRDLADDVGISVHELSHILNTHLGVSFNEYVNGYRVEWAKPLIKNEPHTLESIAYDSGFNSTSAFYSAFKKVTGMTPASYRKSPDL